MMRKSKKKKKTNNFLTLLRKFIPLHKVGILQNFPQNSLFIFQKKIGFHLSDFSFVRKNNRFHTLIVHAVRRSHIVLTSLQSIEENCFFREMRGQINDILGTSKIVFDVSAQIKILL